MTEKLLTGTLSLNTTNQPTIDCDRTVSMPKRRMDEVFGCVDIDLYASFVIVYSTSDGAYSGPSWVLLRNDKSLNLARRLCMLGVCANSYLDTRKKKLPKKFE